MVRETPFVAQPNFVDTFVFARDDALDLMIALADLKVAADRAMRADAGRIFDFPHTRAQSEIARGQRADRTNIDCVAAELGIESRIGE